MIEDPVRQEIIDMYEEEFVSDAGDDEVLTEEKERTMRVNAMVEVALRVRKDLDPLLAQKLKTLENLRDYKQYLLAEFKIFGEVEKAKVEPVFAEYLLFSIMDEFEVDEHINFEIFDALNFAYRKMPAEYRDFGRIFPWGCLIDR